ncbi:MAG: sigma-70 family RNA polymerase sigma factor [Verrucomicrobia bacterium]|nr:sigma-70 family RNA polymerase sigma factor [Verrucomicrobiota bacterium]
MAYQLPKTPLSLLVRLRDEGDQSVWQVSWKRFLELYNGPLLAMASGFYRHYTGGATPPQNVLEDAVAKVVVGFFNRNRFDPGKGRLRTYLRLLVKARIVEALRKERPLNHLSLDDENGEAREALPKETPEETQTFQQALLATLIEDLRETIPLRHFQIFEMVKLREMPVEQVASELGVARGVVDNTVYKVMKRLREIASAPEYQTEYYL